MSAVQKDDQEVEDTLTTEEELFLKHETMRDFFIQELKALRESVSSVQKAAQDDLKAFTEVTEMNFMEELQHNTERTHRQLQCDLQMLEENSKTALQKVEVQVKAMEESVVSRMVTLEGKLDAVLSRLTAIEADVCRKLVAPETTQGTTFNLTGRAASLSSASGPLLSSGPSKRVVDKDGIYKVQKPKIVRDLHTAWDWVKGHRGLFHGEVTEPAFLRMNKVDQQNTLNKVLRGQFFKVRDEFLFKFQSRNDMETFLSFCVDEQGLKVNSMFFNESFK